MAKKLRRIRLDLENLRAEVAAIRAHIELYLPGLKALTSAPVASENLETSVTKPVTIEANAQEREIAMAKKAAKKAKAGVKKSAMKKKAKGPKVAAKKAVKGKAKPVAKKKSPSMKTPAKKVAAKKQAVTPVAVETETIMPVVEEVVETVVVENEPAEISQLTEVEDEADEDELAAGI
jgi:hypothetical protein